MAKGPTYIELKIQSSCNHNCVATISRKLILYKSPMCDYTNYVNPCQCVGAASADPYNWDLILI